MRRAGDPEPEASAAAFLRAASHPALSSTRGEWASALLRTARPGFGAERLLELAESYRSECGRDLDPACAPTLPLVLGSSNTLARMLQRQPAWVDQLEGPLPGPPEPTGAGGDWEAVRATKYRGLLRIAARDLAGRDFSQSLRELSDLADHCLAAGLALAADETGVPAPSLLALGKLGGRELNFSSDVDLLFVYDVPAGRDPLEYNHEVARLVRHLKQNFEAPTPAGFAYRVDLDLRPEGRTGVLANSVDAALSYYETFGAEWERQMLLRLRAVAGAEAPARELQQGILPFVYRRSIDPRVLEEVRAMKMRIEDERRRAGRDLESELKEGPGGIRDVEFLVQSLQLFFGGRELSLRTGNVLDALSALGSLSLVSEATAAALASAYLWLRRAEHAVQLTEEHQTARFPRRPADQVALARRMGYSEPVGEQARAQLLEEWTTVRNEVRHHFDALVLSGTS
ncbi:MAG: hypothetical protein QNK03_14585 [Myxococcota bacterium]|nr:hypothetical protein [Myxococcota bacterium]